MPVSRKALDAHHEASKKTEDANALLREIRDQQKQILAALKKLTKK